MGSIEGFVAAARRDLSAARRLRWSSFPELLDSFSGSAAAFFVLYAALVVAVSFFLPSFLISSDPQHVVGYLLAPVLLVLLAWGTVTWFFASIVGTLVLTVLSGRSLATVPPALGSSIARIATWTGRLTIPVLLASIVAWVLGIGPSANGQLASILRNVAVLQVGMLFCSLTVMVCFEAVHIVFRHGEALPWTVRVPAAAGFALGAWTVVRRVWHLGPSVERVLDSVLPAELEGFGHADLVHGYSTQVPSVPWGFGAAFVAIVLCCLVTADVRRRSRG